jgi:hypothetical protein
LHFVIVWSLRIYSLGASWVDGLEHWMGQIWKGWEDEKKIAPLKVDETAGWSSTMKMPVIVGEFGTIEPAERESRMWWTEYRARETEKGYSIWCTGNSVLTMRSIHVMNTDGIKN